jgi:hypothetical protein
MSVAVGDIVTVNIIEVLPYACGISEFALITSNLAVNNTSV